jgi:tyrosine-protein phosphatase SIW14
MSERKKGKMPSLSRSLLALLVFSVPVFGGPSVQGIKNFYQVDDHVYRGGQPSEDGFRYLAQAGVKTVLDLREAGSRSAAEEKAVTALGMKYVNIPMSGLIPPTNAEVTRALGLLEDNTTGPVFVHCQRGADRTGAVIAAYRIDHDHWENARALEEAMADGMSFFQFPRQSYIRKFQPLTVNASATKPVGAPSPSSMTAAPVSAAAAIAPAPAILAPAAP